MKKAGVFLYVLIITVILMTRLSHADVRQHAFIKELQVIRVERNGAEQSTTVKISLGFEHIIDVESISVVMLRDSEGGIYEIHPEKIHYSTDTLYFIEEVPSRFPDGPVTVLLYDKKGNYYNYDQHDLRFADSVGYNGKWSGKTNQGYDISFLVNSDKVTSFSIKTRISGSKCSLTSESTTTFYPGWPINNKSFTINLSLPGPNGYKSNYIGTFTGDFQANGTWNQEDFYCGGYGSGNWSAALANNCAATLSNNLNLHVPIIYFNNQLYYWADFAYDSKAMNFILSNVGVPSDISSFSGCTQSTLSAEGAFHIPTIIFGSSSYWADLQYAHDLFFTLTGAGLN